MSSVQAPSKRWEIRRGADIMQPEEGSRFINVRPVQKAPESRIDKQFAAYGAGAKSPFHRQLE
jgi:hypothetical protein